MVWLGGNIKVTVFLPEMSRGTMALDTKIPEFL
jgi:hypothetical protein